MPLARGALKSVAGTPRTTWLAYTTSSQDIAVDWEVSSTAADLGISVVSITEIP
jgi:hypothetical protein